MRVGRFFGSYRMLPVPHVTWELAKKSAQPADYVWAGKGAAPLRAAISDAGPGREKLPGKLFLGAKVPRQVEGHRGRQQVEGHFDRAEKLRGRQFNFFRRPRGGKIRGV